MSPYRPVDMKEWERASIPEDSDNLRYDINDEYIALDDDDEEIVIDL